MPTNELHEACGYGGTVDAEEAMRLALAKPEWLREFGHGGSLPLHWAAYHGAPLHLVVALVEAYPEALAVLSDDAQTHK